MNDIEKAIEIYKDNIWHMEQNPDAFESDLPRFKLVLQALEKQIPKKCETDEENNFYNCPCCNEDLMGCYGENDEIANYCLWCGQKLDWSDNSER